MPLFKFLILAPLLCFLNVKGQNIHYKNLLDTVTSRTAQLFVYVKPIDKIRLDKEDVRINYDDLRDLLKVIDTTILFQIVDSSKNIDTSNWTDAEFDKSILIQDRNEKVRLSYVIRKFNLTEKKVIRYYKRQVNQFNSLDPADKVIYYYSRPVFDSSKLFAIVQWHNGHGWLGGGGGIKLYHLIDGTWREQGTIKRWSY